MHGLPIWRRLEPREPRTSAATGPTRMIAWRHEPPPRERSAKRKHGRAGTPVTQHRLFVSLFVCWPHTARYPPHGYPQSGRVAGARRLRPAFNTLGTPRDTTGTTRDRETDCKTMCPRTFHGYLYGPARLLSAVRTLVSMVPREPTPVHIGFFSRLPLHG